MKPIGTETVVTLDWMRSNVSTTIDGHYHNTDDPRTVGWDHVCRENGTECHWIDCYLPYKRRDFNYPPLVTSLKVFGFLRPLCITERPGDTFQMGNGHHRLAAAVELDMTDIPIVIDSHDYMRDEDTTLPYHEWKDLVHKTPELKMWASRI